MSIYLHGGIYKITNLNNNKSYIGQTDQEYKSRWQQHRWLSGDGTSPLHKAMREEGKENFVFEVICSCFAEDIEKLKEELNRRETHFIDLYLATNKKFGYNCNRGGYGDSSLGKKRSEEARARIKAKQPDRKGKKGSSYNHTIYDWVHPKYGAESCTRGDLCLKYKINNDKLKLLIDGKYKQYLGWELKISPYKRVSRYGDIVYQWINLDGRRETLTIAQLTEKYNLRANELNLIILEMRNTHRGWGLFSPDKKLRSVPSGKDHFEYDHTIYHWINKNGAEEMMTRYGIVEKYSLDLHYISRIIHKKKKDFKGWSIIF